MCERPILMSAPMVLGILSNRKTQTRRIVKKVLTAGTEHPFSGLLEADCILDHDHLPSRLDMMSKETDLCPKGVVGDRLWVRETYWIREGKPRAFRINDSGASYEDDTVSSSMVEMIAYKAAWGDQRPEGCTKWKPSIFMPRRASRITLEITGVRVERLQDISEEDAIAEGILPSDTDLAGWRGTEKSQVRIYAVNAYGDLWESINGAGSWNANPWCWCISFKRLT